MSCYNSTALSKGDEYSQIVMIRSDAIDTRVGNLIIQANVSSKSDEGNQNDNMVTNTIHLIGFSNFEITG